MQRQFDIMQKTGPYRHSPVRHNEDRTLIGSIEVEARLEDDGLVSLYLGARGDYAYTPCSPDAMEWLGEWLIEAASAARGEGAINTIEWLRTDALNQE